VKTETIYTKTLVICLIIMLLMVIGCSRKGIPPRDYTISGTVTLNGTGTAVADVTIQLTGASTASATTGSDGKFSFTGLANGTYYVTPSLTDYSFDPINNRPRWSIQHFRERNKGNRGCFAGCNHYLER
jgi:hypothetical protein